MYYYFEKSGNAKGKCAYDMIKVFELSGFYQSVQHIGNILPVDVMKFYIYFIFTCSYNHAKC